MTQELLYTSAPQGLNPGSRGFCTVVRTRSMPGSLETVLESLSGYRPAFPLNDPRASQNPVNYSHVRAAAGGKTLSVLSRVADYGFDYSQRTNKIAHHVVLASEERPEAGPAWLLAQPGFMDARWDGQPRTLPAGRRAPAGTERAGRCASWAALTGDAGWAGVLAESWLSGTPTYVIFEPGTDMLSLIREAVALLPPRKRWDATFATYFTGMPSGVACSCRCVVADSQEAVQARRLPNVQRIDLTQRLSAAPASTLVEAARTGAHQHAAPAVRSRDAQTVSAVAPEMTQPRSAMVTPSGSTQRTKLPQAIPIAAAEPPPLERIPPAIRNQRRTPLWVWLVPSLSVAAVVLVAVVVLSSGAFQRASEQVASLDAANQKKAAQPAAQDPAIGNKPPTPDKKAVAGKGDQASTGKGDVQTPAANGENPAKPGGPPKATPPPDNQTGNTVAGAAGTNPSNTPPAGAGATVGGKPISDGQKAPQKPDGKGPAPAVDSPIGKSKVAATDAAKKDEKKTSDALASANPTGTKKPSDKHDPDSVAEPLPAVLKLPEGLKEKQDHLIPGTEIPDGTGMESIEIWVPVDDKQPLNVSRLSPASAVVFLSTTPPTELATFRFDQTSHAVVITPRLTDELGRLRYCVLCINCKKDRKKFQFFAPFDKPPTSPSRDHPRPSWTIAISKVTSETPPLRVESVALRSSKATYIFRPDEIAEKRQPLSESLTSAELNDQLGAAAHQASSNRDDLKIALRVKQIDSGIDFWLPDLKKLFSDMTKVHESRFVEFFDDDKSESAEERQRRRGDARKRIKKQVVKGNERQKIIAALKQFRTELDDKEKSGLDVDRKKEALHRRMHESNALLDDLTRAQELETEVNALAIKSVRLFYELTDQNGKRQKNYLIRVEGD